jgi:integrase
MWERMRESKRQPHPQKALTVRAVQAAQAGDRTRRIGDGGGLFLIVFPSGAKSWVLRTVVKGKRCDLGLGSATLTSLAAAREEARRLRRIARTGGDPLAERRHERRPVPTFEQAARQVHAGHEAAFRNEKHRKQWLSSLSGVIATCGSKRVDAVTSADVLSVLSQQWLDRPETARRVLQRLRVIFDWCKAQGYCVGDNPTDGLTKVLPKHRATKAHHAALPYTEVPGFLRALRASDASEPVKLGLELTILCATRTSETLHATWTEVDLPARTWTIPGERMKVGVAHRIPLSPRCVEILTRAQVLSDDSPYVFPGRRRARPLSNMTFLMTLRRMRRNDVTTHGFRSSFRDWAAERTNVPGAVCEAALAHTVRDKVEAAYFRTDLFERRRELMNAWAAFATGNEA